MRGEIMAYAAIGVFFGLILLLIVFLVLLGKIVEFAEKVVSRRYLEQMNPKKKYALLFAATIAFECAVVLAAERIFHFSFISTLFAASIGVLVLVWYLPYYISLKDNISTVSRKHNGYERGEVKIFNPKNTPFFSGSILFSGCGLLVSLLYYFI
ncbi:hypothetical protein V1498_19980 [Peribacillus sp. SCS-26]|uniref:hypothetical protein n=1 Tax=Paraperibacillus marinus TaxID=3115295 RepID=UPI0039066EFA